MLHPSSRIVPGSRHAPTIAPPGLAVDAGLEVVAGAAGSPRTVVWTATLRALAGELQLAQDSLDPDADGGAWVVSL